MQILLSTKFEHTAEQLEKIQQLRDLVETSNELEIGTDDVFLSKFLSFGGWEAKRAYDAIIRYYDFKQHNPDWLAHHPVLYFRDHIYQTLSKYIMPKPDKDGRVIFVSKTVDAFKTFPNYIYDIIEMDDLILESILLLPQAQKYGITIISDLSGTNKRFLRFASPAMAKMVNAKNDVMPFVSRIVHVMQRGMILNATTNLMMSFASKEFKERIHIHDGKNFDKLRNMVGYENLPAEYGGPKENELDVNILYEHLSRHSEYLLKLQNYRKKSSN
ncbi:retinaldehyde-binding protein 1 [Anastrepha ludens]|uniref:retinaldehyde-binding protein 1 n=1 Tax=Anastrepha ludens TaxID=28586 RepID=UPI0023AE91CC|nr:retinaldehyde-binding protein 1 [Anastrepha ludens]